MKESKNATACFFSAGTVNCHAPSTRLILWLPVRVTKHCCFLVYLPAAGFRGTTGRIIQAWKNKEITLLATLQILFVCVAQGHAFLLQILVQEYWCHYQKLHAVAFGFGWASFFFIRIPNKRFLLVWMDYWKQHSLWDRMSCTCRCRNADNYWNTVMLKTINSVSPLVPGNCSGTIW